MSAESFPRLRRAAGLSQVRCAAFVGRSLWVVRQFDAGAREVPAEVTAALREAVESRGESGSPRERWGRGLRVRRALAGLTQSELAEAVGVQRASVGYWESGGIPQYDSRRALAAVLGWDRAEMGALLTEAEGTPRD